MAKSTYQELNINEIELDTQNPRIKMYLETYHEITAFDIALALNGPSSDGSFTALRESIRVNGGVINPILVNHTAEGKYVVIEGNTRLQIYKDFHDANPDGSWEKIRAIVYENMDEEEIHSIRLQTHLVGPRDWDPYSKAKYLSHLMYEERLPMPTIISYCGGNSKKNEILKLVDAYQDMQKFYIPKARELEYDIDYKDFSKFAELQNKGIIDCLKINGFTKEDFAGWVLNGNIDTAQNVRLLPTIFKEKSSKAEFLKSNISEAYKKVSVATTPLDFSSVDCYDLSKVLTTKLDKLEWKEVLQIRSDKGEDKRAILSKLEETIKLILENEAEDD